MKLNVNVILLAAFMATPLPSAHAAITDGLAGHWTFDDASGAALEDSTSNGNDATLFNFPEDGSQWVSGQIGGALQFGGPTSLDYVIVPNYPKPSEAMTISIWVWTDVQPTDWAMVVNDWRGSCGQFHVGLFGGVDMANFTQIDPCGGGPLVLTREGVPFPVGSWQHIAFVADGQFMRQYRNGQEVASLPYEGSVFQPDVESFGIGLKPNDDGTGPGNTAWLWQGKMDDLGIWTRALPPDEVNTIYQQGLEGKNLAGATPGLEPPTILTHPRSQNRFVGESFSLSVRAAGTGPLTYQWSKDEQVLAGQTAEVLTLGEATTAMAGSYKVEVRNNLGSILSDAAVVTVTPVENVSTGLVGHWKLDETSGETAADAAAPPNGGTLVAYSGSNSQWVAGEVGGALQFGGVDAQNYVEIADYPKPDSGLVTVSAWVWNDVQEGLSFPVAPYFIASWGSTSAKQQFRVGLEADHLTGSIQTSGGLVSTTEAASFVNQSWQHIALVVDGTDLRLYRNGFDVAAVPHPRPLTSPAGPLSLTLGNLLDDAGGPIGIPNALFGKMDDVGLWGRALAPIEIMAVYQAGLAGRDLSTASINDVTDVPPSISIQPQAVTELFAGESFSLSVQALGTPPLSYQWSKDGIAIAGATSRSYAVASGSESDAGTYTVAISNVAGNLASSPALVTVAAIETMAAGLVGHWKFDETSGTALTDSTTHANHGTLGNFPVDDSQWVPGQIGRALAFRGPLFQDHVVVPDYPKPTTRMAISIWVLTDVRPADWAMVVNDWSGSCGQFHVGLFGGVDMANFTAPEPCEGTPVPTREGTAFPVGSWQHVAFVGDGESLLQYRNGQEVARVPYDGTIFQPSVKSFGIGMKPNGDGSGPGAFFWEGKMDDLGIWRRSLSPAEVASIYQAGLAGNDLATAPVPQDVSLSVVQSGGSITISWPATAVGYVLESAASAGPGTTWQLVEGVTGNSYTTTATVGNTFYRLRKP